MATYARPPRRVRFDYNVDRSVEVILAYQLLCPILSEQFIEKL